MGEHELLAAVRECNSIAVRQALADGAAPSLRTQDATPAVLIAARCENADVVAALLERGADPDSRDSNQETALMAAASVGNAAAVRALIEAGADVNALSNEHNSALICAAAARNLECVLLLLNAGAKATQRNHQGFSALDLAGQRPLRPLRLFGFAYGRSTRVPPSDPIVAALRAAGGGDTDPPTPSSGRTGLHPSGRALVLAFLVAPLGAVAMFAILSILGLLRPLGFYWFVADVSRVSSTARLLIFVAVATHAVGLVLLPLAVLYNRLGWRHWAAYAATAASAGVLCASLVAWPVGGPWTFYAVYALSGVASASVFVTVLQRRLGYELTA